MSGSLIKFKKEDLLKIGDYSKGYTYITEDKENRVLLLKPASEGKHVYVIPNFHKIKTTCVAKAIYKFLHEEGKDRTAIFLKDKTGKYDFYCEESVLEIFRKLTRIDECNLSSI